MFQLEEGPDMDGDHWIAAIAIVCITTLDLTALTRGIDGAWFTATLGAICGIVELLRYRKAKRRGR
jgi:hypothetical protein